MNARERLLGASVLGLLLMMVAYFVWSSWQDAVTRRRGALTNLEKMRSEQDRTLRQASRANRDLDALQKRSLPKDRERANSLYQSWLLGLVDRVGFADPAVTVAERRARANGFERLRFTVDGIGTLGQVTNFLAEFYSVGDLHRIQQLSLKPITGTRQLDLLITIEAISLTSSDRATIGDTLSNRWAGQDLEQLKRAVLDRSLFFPANVAPQIAKLAEQRVIRDTQMTLRASATDPDPGEKLEFQFQGAVPEGMELSRTAEGEVEIRWQPKELGEYDIELSVADSGSPRGTATQKVHISVVDPPPPVADTRRAAEFDDATQTFLVGTVANGESRQAWFSVRTKGQLLKLNVGDALAVGTVLGNLQAITDTHVEISTQGGATTRVRIGQALTEGVTVQAAPATADANS